MGFSLGRFVMHLPADGLERYFRHRDIDCPGIDWSRADGCNVKAITAGVERLADPMREQVYADFERIEEMTDEVGERAMLAAVPDRQAAIRYFDGMDGAHARALWLLIHDEGIFRRAEEIRFADYNRRSNQWDGFLVHGRGAVSRSPDAVLAFKVELQRFFREQDGSGRAIEVDIFERPLVADRESRTPRDELVQVTAYLEGMPAVAIEFEGQAVGRRVRRPALEVALTYSALRRTVEVISRGGRPAREQVARAFLATLLGQDKATVERVALREFSLNTLAKKRAFPTDPEDGIRSVEVIRLRLRPYGDNTGRVTLEKRRDNAISLYDLADRWFGRTNPLRSGFSVEHARLAIEFHPEAGRSRGDCLYLELTTPHRCNLKDRTRQQSLIGEKYIERWELLKTL